MIIEMYIGIGVVVFLLLLGLVGYYKVKLKNYENYIIQQDGEFTKAIEINERSLARINLAKDLIADSSISKSEKTIILQRLEG